MLVIVGARCFRSGLCVPSWFMSHCCSKRTDRKSTINFTGRPHPEGFIRYLEVGGAGAQHYKSCLSPMSEQGEFFFVKPFSHSTTAESMLAFEQAGSVLQSPSDGQAQPNTDWRFSQAQRPGTSGSQNGDENGTWPNNQFDTEMLQAMILASANEAAAAAAANPDGNSTLGGGATAAGTMGLSTRYGPQFTLQHVPDYRQNVYIPGSTATLSNSAAKRDGKPAASGGGNKKKSGKKEKK
ncbi:protocadherin gamma-C5 isoform X8 [Podarcis muralis]